MTVTVKGIEMVYRALVTFPQPPANDPGISNWMLTPVHDGVDQPTITGEASVTSTEIRFPALPGGGSPVINLLFSWVDKAGNVGTASKFTFSQPDDIAPAEAGQVSVTILGTEDETAEL